MGGESGAYVLTHGRMLWRDEGCGDEMDTCVVDSNLTSLILFPEWVNSSASHACNRTYTFCISLWSSINYLVLQQGQGQSLTHNMAKLILDNKWNTHTGKQTQTVQIMSGISAL